MHETCSVTEIARHFADYINRVVYRGERFVLVRGNKPVAELGALACGEASGRAAGSARLPTEVVGS